MTTIDEALEAARVSDRLGRLEQLAASSDDKLARLVALSERREKRESEEASFRREIERVRLQHDLDEQTRTRGWIRSLISPEVAKRVAAAMIGIALGGGGVTGWLALPANPQHQQPNPPHPVGGP